MLGPDLEVKGVKTGNDEMRRMGRLVPMMGEEETPGRGRLENMTEKRSS